MKSSVLYITRNGLLEPLGQSQVFSYLKGLSSDYRITLISFEKPQDRNNLLAIEKMRGECQAHNIRWLPQPFHYKPKLVAPLWSMIIFLNLCLKEVKNGNADIIHARSYIPAAVALVVNYLKGTPFIFDMRALWPEELVTAGSLKRDSIIYKILIEIERKCLAKAATVVSLTHAAVNYLKEKYPNETAEQDLVVISTCADLDRFLPLDDNLDRKNIYSCIGTVLSGWFQIDWLGKFFHKLSQREPEALFEIITRDDKQQIYRAFEKYESLFSKLKIFSLPSNEVHKSIQRHTASAMFFKEELGKLGSAPTRMGEILGCGIPIIANAGIGDVAYIIQKYNVGVLVKDDSSQEIEKTIEELFELMQDKDLSERCRKTAEEIFSLQKGIESYRRIYNKIFSAHDKKTKKSVKAKA